MTPTDWVALYLNQQLPPKALEANLPPEALTAIVEALKQAADDHWFIDPKRSLIYAERIVVLATQHHHTQYTALGHMARGDALKFLGQMPEAWAALELAGQMYLSAGDEVGWARTRIGRLYVGVHYKRVAEVLADVEPAAAILMTANLPDRLVRLRVQTAYVYNYLGDHDRAIALLTEQKEQAQQWGADGQILGVIHLNLGSTHLFRGEFAEAWAHYEQARTLAEARGDTLNLALIEANFANVYRQKGQHRRALLTLERAQHYAATDEAYQTLLQQDLAECYLHLNRYAEASTVAQAASQKLRASKKNFELARTLVLWATAEMAQGHYAQAQPILDEAAAIFQELNSITGKMRVALWRGHLALLQNQLAVAHTAAQQAAQLADGQHQQVQLAQAQLLRAQVAVRQQDWALAEQTGTTALATARQHNLPALRYSAHTLLGQVAEAQTRWGRAHWHYQAAEAVLERQQRHLTLTLRSEFLVDKQAAFRALIALHLRRGQAEAAWLALERAKSQNWLGYVTHQDQLRWQTSDAESRALVQELENLRGEYQWWQTQAQAAPPPDGAAPAYAPTEIHRELQARERRLRAVKEKLYLHNNLGERYNPAPLASLNAVQNTLDEATALVEFYSEAEQMWAFVMKRHSLQAVRLAEPVAALARLHKKLQFNLRTLLQTEPASSGHGMLAAQTLRLLQKLHTGIFQPLGLTAQATPTLILVPYGAWHLFPFHLLHDGQGFLFEQFELANLPAASLRPLAPPRRGPGALILSHSASGRLPYTRTEAEWLHQQLGGQWLDEAAATRAALHHPPRQVLHVAAHGHYRPDVPDLSFLQLADGHLYADDLFQQDLSYELVTLSACETGQVNAQGHDELIGLGRGFLFAGAGALLQSLWQVPDAVALALMKSFYTQLQAGAAKTTALRHALNQQLLANGPAHLAEWGAFQLIGHTGPLSPNLPV